RQDLRNFPACSIEKLALTRPVILVRDAIPQLLQSQLEVAMLVGQQHSARRGVAADAEILCQRRDQLVVAWSRSQQFDSDRSNVHVGAAFSSSSRSLSTRSMGTTVN